MGYTVYRMELYRMHSHTMILTELFQIAQSRSDAILTMATR